MDIGLPGLGAYGPAELVAAIRDVTSGDGALSPRVARRLMDESRRSPSAGIPAQSGSMSSPRVSSRLSLSWPVA